MQFKFSTSRLYKNSKNFFRLQKEKYFFRLQKEKLTVLF